MITIAHDEAFNFTYRANIDALKQIDDIRFFSPLHDEHLPDSDLLYLPGGYPELYADQLSANSSMLQSIKDFAEKGGKIFAECGGFMYLCKDIDGIPLCNVLPLEATMNGARLHLGYRKASYNGLIIRGHEFHYSSIIIDQNLPKEIKTLRIQSNAKNNPVDTPIYLYKNTIAGYTHWYWAENLKEILNTINYK